MGKERTLKTGCFVRKEARRRAKAIEVVARPRRIGDEAADTAVAGSEADCSGSERFLHASE